MQKWFSNLINYVSRLRATRSASNLGVSSLSRKAPPAAKPATHSEQTPPKLLIWTKDEAELAFKEKRTEVNLASILPGKVNTVQSASGSFMVDGKPTRVVVCGDEAAKKWLWEASKQRVLSEEQEVGRIERERQNATEEEWRRNGCVKDASGQWEVPDELTWRSLPRGEDR